MSETPNVQVGESVDGYQPSQDADGVAHSRRFKGLTPKQVQVLGQIALGWDGGHHPKTLTMLLRRGLIEQYDEVLGGQMPLTVRRYVVPMSVHMDWCAWCAQQPEVDDT